MQPFDDYDEDDFGPLITLQVPLEIARSIRDLVYREGTPNMGLNGLVVDELNDQIRHQITTLGET